MELVCESAMRPAISQHMLDDTCATLVSQNADLVADPLWVASEGVVSAAYSGALARPTVWTGAPIGAALLQDFHTHVRCLSNSRVSHSNSESWPSQLICRVFVVTHSHVTGYVTKHLHH